MPRVSLITGCSTDFGNFFIYDFNRGDVGVATARRPKDTSSKNYATVRFDVCNPKDIDSTFAEVFRKICRVNVVVNTPGYGLSGPFEDLADEHMKI